MRHHVARVSYDEHISNVGLSEPGGQHPGVHTGHEHRSGVGIISHPLEVLEHVSLPVCSIPHDPMEDILNSLRHLSCHPKIDLKMFVLFLKLVLVGNVQEKLGFTAFITYAQIL